MKLKLDENLGNRGAALFREAGFEVSTVPEESLCGATDKALIGVCREETKCLVTLDLDFGNPMVFNPAQYHGIAVIRLPPRASDEDLWQACKTLILGLRASEISAQLWVVQRDHIRQYQPDGEAI